MTLSTIHQDGVIFELRMEDGYKIYMNNGFTGHFITAPDKDIAIGYFEDYVRALK